MRQERVSISPLLLWPKSEPSTWQDFPGREEIDSLIDTDPFEAREMARFYRDAETDRVLRNRYHGLFLIAESRCVPTPSYAPMHEGRPVKRR